MPLASHKAFFSVNVWSVFSHENSSVGISFRIRIRIAKVTEMQVASWITEDIVRMLKPVDKQVIFDENIKCFVKLIHAVVSVYDARLELLTSGYIRECNIRKDVPDSICSLCTK